MFSIGLSEIVLPVKDVKSAARFYQEVVGLIPDAAVSSWKGAHEEWAWFWAGEPGKRQRVALLQSSHANERFVIKGVSDFPAGGAGVRSTLRLKSRETESTTLCAIFVPRVSLLTGPFAWSG